MNLSTPPKRESFRAIIFNALIIIAPDPARALKGVRLSSNRRRAAACGENLLIYGVGGRQSFRFIGNQGPSISRLRPLHLA